MRYRILGGTGVSVSTLCLGAMMFGSAANTDRDECGLMVSRALDSGVNFVDTADVYSVGESEEILGHALKGRRDEVVIATKCYNPMGPRPNQRGGSRRWIVQAVEGSLSRLGTDYIDLYQMHRYDSDTRLDETLGALTDLVQQGKVRYIGSSSFPPDILVEAQWISDRRRLARFATEQPQYSIFARSAEASVLSVCMRHDISVVPWSPLAGGWLTGKYRRGTAAPAGSRFSEGGYMERARARIAGRQDGRTMSEPSEEAMGERYRIVDDLLDVAGRAGMPLAHVALAFVLEHPAVASTIIGPRTPAQLEDLLPAADLRLDEETLDAIDAIVAPGTDVAGIDHFVANPGLRRKELRRRPH